MMAFYLLHFDWSIESFTAPFLSGLLFFIIGRLIHLFSSYKRKVHDMLHAVLLLDRDKYKGKIEAISLLTIKREAILELGQWLKKQRNRNNLIEAFEKGMGDHTKETRQQASVVFDGLLKVYQVCYENEIDLEEKNEEFHNLQKQLGEAKVPFYKGLGHLLSFMEESKKLIPIAYEMNPVALNRLFEDLMTIWEKSIRINGLLREFGEKHERNPR